ncbi:MAG: hypothetical protein ACRETT_14390, partial [Steroidobacteraceae bacterium]
MRGITKPVVIVLAAVLVAAAVVAFDFLQHNGLFKTLKPYFAGTCTPVPLAASAEDIRIDHDRGIAYLSYLDRRAVAEGKARKGTVALLDLSVANPRPRPALATEPAGFRPHGLSLY